jgi:L-iditol 2-dehydrogenase
MWAHLLVGPRQLDRVEVPAVTAAQLQDGQVLLRTLAGGICGSDLPRFRGVASPPVGPGPASSHADRVGQPLHEVVGEVLASRHPDVAVGTRVVGWATGFDGLAEFVISRGDELSSYDRALAPTTAVLLQPLACVLYVLEQLPDLVGTQVAVLGLGPIGVLFTHALKAAGAARVTGVDPVDRRDVAARFGIDVVQACDSGHWAAGLPDRDRPGILIESVGHQISTLRHAIDAVAFGGTVYYFGLPDDPEYPFPMRTFLRKNLTLISGGTLDRRRMLTAADAYLRAHPDLAEGYVTDVYPAAAAQEAFERASVPARGRLKVVLEMA